MYTATKEVNDEVIMQKLKEKFEDRVKSSKEQKCDEMPISLVDDLPKKGRGSIIKSTEISPDKNKMMSSKSSDGGSKKGRGRGRRQSFSPEAKLPTSTGNRSYKHLCQVCMCICIYIGVHASTYLYPYTLSGPT